LLVITDTPDRGGRVNYTSWANDFANYLGESFSFIDQINHPYGYILKFHTGIFSNVSLFGESINLLVRMTEDKMSGQLTDAFIVPVADSIPPCKRSIALTQFIDKPGLANGLLYYMESLIIYYLQTYLKAFEGSLYSECLVTSRKNFYHLIFATKIEDGTPVMSVEALLKTTVMFSLYNTLMQFGMVEDSANRMEIMNTSMEGETYREIHLHFKGPSFLDNLKY